MKQAIAQVTLVVQNYDKAIEFYTKKLGFNLVDDIALEGGKRWVTVSPPSLSGLSLLLAEATNEEQRKAVGNQSGGRVFLFLHTDNFWRDYKRMKEQGVTFNEDPREEPYGTVVVFKDLYGNLWDLIERK
ncbi:VOC family protein [Zobellia galactanivorans]|uniref:Glyoxalase superfamily protein n=1 Tax=Zobellia galactanivorans (strain DSM 12802 / CCUG 47099 / CIP 106680 / NCIMB 13871 / Dsij) TaxID=63186 RepID=G0L7M1_ZOBGA|nr:VOC family protein [Zobellia galactanivorans]CAZ98152.1 Glyoxalase superfamily protein [Zobellia galactanivorans]